MRKIIQKPILILLCAVMVLSACLTGCKSNEPNFPVALSDTTRSAFELCTKGYKDTELDKIYQFMLDDEKINAKKLHDKYEIQCLRKDDDGYAVYYIGNTRILLLRFNEKGEWVKRDRLHSMYRVTETRGKFDLLKEGDNVTKVQSTDPVAYFPFLADPSGTDLRTDHYTGDGYHTVILYDDNYNISSINYGLI
ncbi:hypothetical protein [Ruminococcus sp.]|uniref:hypothetical protein n=1 Tax=Ruminococcus sp. TaxID=41978 RepID=UPI002E8081C5|nr:hypothetical protein [Ruminococcus sp.]MEE3492012.1 hypothetical protein [Ruminococcus sp.]